MVKKKNYTIFKTQKAMPTAGLNVFAMASNHYKYWDIH